MTAAVRKPAKLNDHEFLVIVVTRDTKEIALVLPDQQSFDLGSVWDANQSAVAYIGGALGRESHWRRLAEEAITTAFNFGAAIIDIERRLVCSVMPNDPKQDEARALVRMFDGERHFLERDDRNDHGFTVVEAVR